MTIRGLLIHGLIFLALRSASAAAETVAAAPAAPVAAYPWVPGQGDGTYRNPIIFADYSDPDVVRHGRDFYLTASSFNCTPGLPILHSRDLVNWTIINHALPNLPDARYAEVRPGEGVWAPAIRFHDGRFWIFFPTPDEGIYVTTARDPAGKWSEPHLLQPGKGLIDPCPLWDDDGRAYLVHAYAFSRAGIKHRLRVCPMAPDGSRLLGEGQIVFDQPQRHPTMEGPKFMKRDGWYYILAPAGGVPTGWQVALRSRNVYGPYEDKIVLAQGRTAINGPHQGALVDDPNGAWWFVHFQDAGVYGRIVHLQPVTWKDGWPLMGVEGGSNGIGEPVAHWPVPNSAHRQAQAVPQTTDDFDSRTLGLQWQWQANHQDDWFSLAARRGWLQLFPQRVPSADLGKAPNLLLQKFPAEAFAVETLLDPSSLAVGNEAGLVVAGKTNAAIAVRRGAAGLTVVFRSGNEDPGSETPIGTFVRLRVDVTPGGVCTFSYADADAIRTMGVLHAGPGRWIGAKVGVYALTRDDPSHASHADFDYFHFFPPMAPGHWSN
jgi:beta-xylosidase